MVEGRKWWTRRGGGNEGKEVGVSEVVLTRAYIQKGTKVIFKL